MEGTKVAGFVSADLGRLCSRPGLLLHQPKRGDTRSRDVLSAARRRWWDRGTQIERKQDQRPMSSHVSHWPMCSALSLSRRQVDFQARGSWLARHCMLSWGPPYLIVWVLTYPKALETSYPDYQISSCLGIESPSPVVAD